MKALNISELNEFVASLQPFIDAELGACLVSERDIAFELRKQNMRTWVGVDLFSTSPYIFCREEYPFSIPKQKLPIQLFLKAHFKHATLKKVERLERWGRVIVFSFVVEDKWAEFEFRLFPHGSNWIVRFDEKQLALSKPQDLLEQEQGQEPETIRALDSVFEEWLSIRKKSKPPKPKTDGITRDKKLKKLKEAIEKIEWDLKEKQASKWKQCGEHLVAHQSLEASTKDFEQWIDPSETLAWNIERCFSMHKKNLQKLEGSKKRLRQLQKELLQIQKMSDSEFAASQKKPQSPIKKNKNPKQTYKARSFTTKNGFRVSVGQSAKDNVALLRSCQPWDFWLHLKDFPSAHAILFRNKKQQVGEADIREAAQFLVKVALGSQGSLQKGEKVSVLLAESRYVTPMKSDALGRVTFRNEKSLSVRVNS